MTGPKMGARSLPIPVTYVGAIPTYTAQAKALATYTSLFCFLILGFLFYSRHQLARLMFPEFFRGPEKLPQASRTRTFREIGIKTWSRVVAGLPLFLIVFSVLSLFRYHELLIGSVAAVREQVCGTTSTILASTDLALIPNGPLLMVYYLLIFVAAEAAFILMAIKEYLQDLVGLTEIELILGQRKEWSKD